MAEDGVIRELKHPNLIGRKFSATNQPDPAARNGAARYKQWLLEVAGANDELGAKADLMSLKRGTIQEKQIFWGLVKDALPKEITGALDGTITVKVVTQLSLDAPALPDA